MVINSRISEELLLVSKSAAKHHLAVHSAVRKSSRGAHITEAHGNPGWKGPQR